MTLLGALVLTFGLPVATPGGPASASAPKAKKGKVRKKLRAKAPTGLWVSSSTDNHKSGHIRFSLKGRANAKKGTLIGRARLVFRARIGKRPFRVIATPGKIRLRAGVRTHGKAKLNARGRNYMARACSEPRARRHVTMFYRHRGSKTKRKIFRGGAGCPRPVMPVVIRRPTTPSCDPTDPALCLLPFPNDHFAKNDESTPTGLRLNLADDQMPANEDGARINAADYNAADGFSPGQPILTQVPGLDNPAALTRTDAAPVNQIGRYAEADAPVVLLDTETGERVPLWVELDSQADSPGRTMLQIHPAVPLDPERRYVVALRNLKRADGSRIEARSPFREVRDSSNIWKVPAGMGDWQNLRLQRMIEELENAGIARKDLYLTWEFTVASDRSTTGRLLSIRDRAFETLGDTNMADRVVSGQAPAFTIDSTERFTPAQDSRIARTVRGRVTVPCFLAPDCGVGGRYTLDGSGLPTRNGNWQAPFVCIIPRSAESAPARASVYGHGLFHVKEEVEGLNHRRLSHDHNIVQCATAQIGMSSDDVLNTLTGILPDLSHFPQLADRIQQGILNELFLGRLMVHPQGLVSDPAFRVEEQVGGDPVITTGPATRLGYSGYSLGGILGGTFTAVAPDADRGVLGVPGLRFSLLLPRSTQYDPFGALLGASYPDPLERSLILSLLQQLWDRGEPNGFAKRITSNPLPNTPPHEALILAAIGDHQVSNFSTDILARAIGAGARQPLIDHDRWPGMDLGWGVPGITGYPFAGSGLIYADTGPTRPGPAGTDPPPLSNLPNRSGVDPHSAVWSVPAMRQATSDFLQVNGKVTDPCGPDPCYAGGWTGP